MTVAAAPAPIKSPSTLVTKELFERAYTERYEQTIRMLVKSGYRRQLAEDLAQEAWARAWRFREQFEGRDGSAFGTWVWRIAINVGRGWLRRWDRRVFGSADELSNIESESLTVPGFGSRVEAQVDVERLLNGDGFRQTDKDALIRTYINNSNDVCTVSNNQSKTARRLAVMRARRRAKAWMESVKSNSRKSEKSGVGPNVR